MLNPEYRIDAEFFRKRYLAEDAALGRWSQTRVGTFATVTDGPHGYHVVDEESPIAMLTAKCAANWFAERAGADCIAKFIDDSNARSRLRSRDVILSTRGTVGLCALVTSEALPANLDQDVARISWDTEDEFLPEFVVAYLNSRFGQDHISRWASGMVQQGLSLQKVREIPIPKLSISMQNAISYCVLQALEERRTAASNLSEAEESLMAALGLKDWKPPEPLTYTRRSVVALAAGRIDAEYWSPAKQGYLDALAALPGKPLRGHFRAVREMFNAAAVPGDQVVRNFDLTHALQPVLDDSTPPTYAGNIGSAKKRLASGDLAVSRLRHYLREIALVRTSSSIPAVGSSEFIVLRPLQGSPLPVETLLVFLRSQPVQTILKWSQDGSHHPRFDDDDLLDIPVPDAVCAISPIISTKVNAVLLARQRAIDLLAAAQHAVEIAIEEGEMAAHAFLNINCSF